MNGFRDFVDCLRGRLKVLEWTVSPLEEDLRPKPVVLPRRQVARVTWAPRTTPAWTPRRKESTLVASAIAVAAALGILLLWLFGPAGASPSAEQVRPPPAAPQSAPSSQPEAERAPVVSSVSVPRPTATPAWEEAPVVSALGSARTPVPTPTPVQAAPAGLSRACGANRIPLYPQGQYNAEVTAQISETAGQLDAYSERFKLVPELKGGEFRITDIRVYATPGSSNQVLDFYRRALVGVDCMIERDLGIERLLAFRDLKATFTVTIAPFNDVELAQLGVPFEGYMLILAERTMVRQR
ncbi:MAG: hypothetical protein HYY01_06360 [Chloroflexi bacterium]|nr:hypothetical protein [Chloroflexota bacterium]